MGFLTFEKHYMLMNEKELISELAVRAGIDEKRIRVGPAIFVPPYPKAIIVDEKKIVPWNVGVSEWDYDKTKKHQVDGDMIDLFIERLRLDGVI